MADSFVAYQEKTIQNAKRLAEGLIANGYDVVSGGTDNAYFAQPSVQGFNWKAADYALGSANITVNKNAVPNDPKSPFVTSGIRIGAPAITTRGFGISECNWLVDRMTSVLGI